MNDGNDIDKKIFNYIAFLEETNNELVNTLKHCVRLLAQFSESVPDPDEWDKMIDAFQETINIVEQRVREERTFH
jgi:hypothetical protein